MSGQATAGSNSQSTVATGVQALSNVFHSADQRAITSQRNFSRIRLLELSLLIAAAVVDAAPWPEVNVSGSALRPGPLGASVLFLLAGVLETSVVTTTPERTWYAARALAESARTLAWRYAVGGLPFPLHIRDGDIAFVRRLQEVASQFPKLSIVPDANGKNLEITSWMASLRRSSLPERANAYLRFRIEEQRLWYTSKSQWNRRRASRWSMVLLLIQLLGIAVGCLSAIAGWWSVDALPIIAAVAACVVAWLQIKQHATLAESYSVAAGELADILASAPAPDDERVWALFVDQSENAMSREHTLWRAKKG